MPADDREPLLASLLQLALLQARDVGLALIALVLQDLSELLAVDRNVIFYFQSLNFFSTATVIRESLSLKLGDFSIQVPYLGFAMLAILL